MFEVLVESKPKKERSAAQFVASVVIHVLLITGAVMATKGAAEVVRERLADTTLVFLEPPKPEAPPPDQPPPDAIVSANPPPKVMLWTGGHGRGVTGQDKGHHA